MMDIMEVKEQLDEKAPFNSVKFTRSKIRGYVYSSEIVIGFQKSGSVDSFGSVEK